MVAIVVSPANQSGIGDIAFQLHPLWWATNAAVDLDADGYTVFDPFGNETWRVNGAVTYVGPWVEGSGSGYTMDLTGFVFTVPSSVLGATNLIQVSGLSFRYEFGVGSSGFISGFNARALSEYWDTTGATVTLSDRGDGIDDLLLGGGVGFPEGAYTILPFGGADRFLGGAGPDTIRAGAGNDTVTGGGGDDRLFGGDGADSLVAGSGLDVLEGGEGNDTLRGGSEADELVGGAGNDWYFVPVAAIAVVEQAGGGIDTVVRTSGSYTLGANIENLVIQGAAGARGTGNGLDNAMTGSVAADTLNGAAGNDTLSGGDGADSLSGGTGTDSLNGGAGEDTLLGGDGHDSLVAGSGLDRLEGGIGNDTLRGGSEADTLIGGAGDDWYFVPVAANAVIEEAGGGIDTVVRTTGTYTLGANIENLLIQAATGVGGTGNALDNAMTGSAGADTLNGAAGADTLTGGGGADLFVFSATAHSTPTARDLVADFQSGVDVISLAPIDARVGSGGANDAFVMVGGAFTAAGQLRVVADGPGAWLIQGNTDADLATVELEIRVFSAAAPGTAAGDILL